MIRLALLSVFLALPGLGCIARFGPVVLGVGEVESCSGTYTYSDAGGWSCEGDFVAGAAISDSGARALGGVAEAARSTAATVLGLPQPQPAPKATGP